MVLSCCEFLAVVTNNPLVATITILWATGKMDINDQWVHISTGLANIFHSFSLFALLLLNFDRYLAIIHAIFRETVVTKAKLLTVLGILMIIDVTFAMIFVIKRDVVSIEVYTIIVFVLPTPPMLFINYKLFKFVGKSRRNRQILPEMKKNFLLKSISSCLLVVACYVVLVISVFVSVGFAMSSRDPTFSTDNSFLAARWSESIASMNATFNCLIFFWKNKVLRHEGMKVLKSMKIWRWIRAQPEQ
jgi:hypothetical protein